MALFTDKRELGRQGEYVPMDRATGAERVGLAMMGYNPVGEKNWWGKTTEFLPIPGLNVAMNYGARAIASDSEDYNEVIKRGTSGAWAQEANKLDMAWQAFKIYLAAGGSVGGGGGASQTAGATATPTTGAPVTSGASAAPAGAGQAVQGATAPTTGLGELGSGVEVMSGLPTDMTTTAAAVTSATPTYDVASWTTGTAMDDAGNIVDKNILDEIGATEEEVGTMNRFLDYIKDEMGVETDPDVTKGITTGGEEYNIVSPDVMGRKGSGTGAGTGADLNAERPGSTFVDKIKDTDKKKLKESIDKATEGMERKQKATAEEDYNNWKAAAQAQGLRVIGTDAVNNMGQVVQSYERPDETAEDRKRSMQAIKNMAMGGPVKSIMNTINTGTSNIRDYEDAADEYRNQQSLTTSYLL